MVSTTAVNLARQSASRPSHQLFLVVCDTGPVLVYADDGCGDDLHRRIVVAWSALNAFMIRSHTPALRQRTKRQYPDVTSAFGP